MYGIAGTISFLNEIKNRDRYIEQLSNSFNSKYDKICNYKNIIMAQSTHDNKETFRMKINDNNYYVLLYGNLYNRQEIVDLLSYNNINLEHNNQCEIILKSFILWKEECLNKFNGAYSFVIWNENEEILFFARDRLGVKPFYYSYINDTFVFGSKLELILDNDLIKPCIDEISIAEIIYLGPGKSPGNAIYKNIKELKPASFGYLTKNGIKIQKYWFLKDCECTDSIDEIKYNINSLLKNSIESQISNNSCSFLSGGLDSSIISSILNNKFKQKGISLNTFSVTYENNDMFFTKNKFQPNSDTKFINEMVNYLGCSHKLITIKNDELAKSLYDAVDAKDLPGMADVDSSLLLFCKEVKKDYDIAFSGECADEIFGGYPWYRDKDIRMTKGFPWSQNTDYRKSFVKEDILLPNCENYVTAKYNNTIINTSKLHNVSPLEGRMKEMMRLNLEWFMQTLLDRSEKMSNYSNLEIRVPFCDYKIVEYLYSIPWEIKDYKGYEKGILRESMKDILPSTILWRKKSPYPKTHNPEYLKIVSDILKDIISDVNSPIFNFIKKDSLEKLLKENKSIPWYGQLMTTPQTIAYFIQVNYWLKKYKIIID